MSAPPFAWRRIALPAYGPVIGNGAAIGAVLPVAPIRAHEQLGASLGAAALVVALLGVGQLLGALPAGVLVARVGERTALILAGLVDVVALAVAGFVPHLAVMAVALLVAGLASSVYFLARQGFMIDLLPADRLARGMSLLGGSLRVGMLLGPALGAAAVALLGLQGAFVVAVAGAGVSLAIVLLTPDITASRDRAVTTRGRRGTLWSVLRRHAAVLLTVGAAVVVMQALRQVRLVILPLWATHLGLGGVESSSAFAVAGAVELLLVYPSGWVMDHVGRAAVATPMTLLLAATIAALPLATGFAGLVAVATAMAAANGLGAGIVMTLGADNAPSTGRSEFLGGWRFCGEVGSAGGSLLVAALTALTTLTATALTIGAAGLLGAIWVGWWTRASDRRRAEGDLTWGGRAQSTS